jgi:hypothetical protein
VKLLNARWALALLPVAIVSLVAARRAGGPGAKLEIDPKTSISWWQVNPHLNHLWATTCPEEPSWLPGEGRSAGTGWSVDATDIKLPPGNSDADTIHIPLFPRYKVRPVCTEAVHGELVAPDTVTWQGAHGKVLISSAALITGEKLRDGFARGVVLEADKYPQIIYTIDSVVNVRRGGRDTIHALAIGSLFLHGTTQALNIAIVEWHDVGGTLRVRGRWFMTGAELWSKYGISKSALGLGVGMGIWKQLWMGVDLVLRPEPL